MTSVEGNIDYDMTESLKPIKAREAEGHFLKAKGDGIDETDDEEEKDLNATISESVVHIKSDDKTTSDDKGIQEIKKGILKHQRTYSNKHVEFNMDIEIVPFDESKDFTIEIQIVEQMPKKIVSYAALYAQQAREEEERKNNEAKELKKKSEPKKHCVKCKTSKAGNNKTSPVSDEIVAKEMNIKPLREEQNEIKKETDVLESTSEVCSQPEKHPEEPLDETHVGNEQPGGEETIQNDKNIEETHDNTDVCDCHNENGEHNETDCTACQELASSLTQMEECEIYDKSGNTNQSEALLVHGKQDSDDSMIEETNNAAPIKKENEKKAEFEESHDMNENVEKELTSGLVEMITNFEGKLGSSNYTNEEIKTNEEEKGAAKEEFNHNEEAEETIDESLSIKGEKDVDNNKQIKSNSTSESSHGDMCFPQNEDYSFNDNVNNNKNGSSKSYEVSNDSASEFDCESLSADTEDIYTDPKNEIEPEQEISSLNEQSEEYASENSISKEDKEINNNEESITGVDESLNDMEEKHTLEVDNTCESDEKKQSTSVNLQHYPANGEISCPCSEINKPKAVSEMETGSGSKFVLDKGDFVQKENKLDESSSQSQDQNLLENYSEPINGDEKCQIKSDQNNVQSFSKIEANISSTS